MTAALSDVKSALYAACAPKSEGVAFTFRRVQSREHARVKVAVIEVLALLLLFLVGRLAAPAPAARLSPALVAVATAVARNITRAPALCRCGRRHCACFAARCVYVPAAGGTVALS